MTRMKICSFLLVACVLAASHAYAQNPTESEAIFEAASYGEGVLLMYELDLIPDHWNNVSDDITRAELAQLCTKLLGLYDIADGPAYKAIFDDVPSTHSACAYIQIVHEQGYMNGTGNRLFMPDAPVRYNEAVKLAVSMLGYSVHAEAKGGYPAGYLAVAQQQRLLKGVSNVNSEAMTRGNVLKLFYNTILTDMLIITQVGETKHYAVYEDRNIMTEYLNIAKGTGTVTANSLAGIKGNRPTTEGGITVDGIGYAYEEQKSREILGKNIVFYYDNTENDIPRIYFLLEKNNNTITVKAESIESYAGNKYTILDNDRRVSLSLSMQSDVFYNYKELESLEPELMQPNVGTVVLIDNNSDGNFDVVFVNEYYNLVVNRVDSYQNKILDIDSGAYIPGGQLQRDICIDDFEEVHMTNSFGEAITCDSLQPSTVLEVYRDIDNKLLLARASTHRIVGNMTEIGKDFLTIDKQLYRISGDHRFSFSSLKMDFTYTFYLNAAGEIVYVVPESEYQAAYILRASEGSKIDAEFQIRVINSYGIIENLTFADKVNVTQISGSKAFKAKDAIQLLTSNAGTIRQLIYFSTSETGMINKLIVPYETQSEQDYATNKEYPFIKMQHLMDSWPAALKTGANVVYKSTVKSFANWLPLKDGTIVFNVPPVESATIDENIVSSHGITGFYQDEQVAFNSLMPYKIGGKTDVFMDVLVRFTEVPVGLRIQNDAMVSVVKNVVTALDPDTGEVTNKLTLLTAGTEQSFYTESLGLFNEKNVFPEIGDMIKYSTGRTNKIDDLQMIYDRQGDLVVNGATYWNSIFRCAAGEVIQVNVPCIEWKQKSESYCEKINLAGSVIYVYDNVTNEISLGTVDDIFPGDELAVYSRYAVNRVVIVYKER